MKHTASDFKPRPQYDETAQDARKRGCEVPSHIPDRAKYIKQREVPDDLYAAYGGWRWNEV